LTVQEQSMRANFRRPFLNWKTLAAFLLGFALYPALMLFPYPFFRHEAHAKNIAVYSDQSISPELFPLLAHVEQRLQRSPLDDPRLQHRVFICNSTWLFAFFANTDSHAGGVNKAWLNQYIFLRRAEIQRNRLIGPSGTEVPGERTLVYFISHEIVHTLEENLLGRNGYLRLPAWKREGYADYVARDRGFVFGEQLPAYRRNAYEMNPKRSGLYLRYQLYVTYLLDQEHLTPQQMLTGRIAEPASDTNGVMGISNREDLFSTQSSASFSILAAAIVSSRVFSSLLPTRRVMARTHTWPRQIASRPEFLRA